MKLLKGFICLAILVTSPFLLLQGLSNARVPAGPVSWNGFWEADLAGAFLQVDEDAPSLQLTVSDLGLEMATHAYTREPFATDALFLRAVDYRSRGAADRVEQIVDLGLGLDKRNRQLGVFQLEQAALANDFAQAFATIDRLTITNPRLVLNFVQPLTAVLEQDGALPILREALADQPHWADAFWRSIPPTSDGVRKLYRLRQMTDAGSGQESDALLLSALVEKEFYSDAFEFWEMLVPGQEAEATAFMETTEYAPIGWRAVVAGDRSFSELGSGEFGVYVEEQTFGELARQLVRLEPGRYELSARVSPATAARDIEVELTCAFGTSDSLVSQSLADAPQWRIGEDCEIYWLILTGSAWERRSSLEASFSQMSLRQVY